MATTVQPTPKISTSTLYALPIWVAYGAYAPVAVYSFVNTVVVLIVCALGVYGWAGWSRTAAHMWAFFRPELVITCFLWGTFTCLWAPDPAASFIAYLKIVALIAIALAAWSGIRSLSLGHLRTLQSVLLISGGTLLLIYFIESVFGFPIARILKEVDMPHLTQSMSEHQRNIFLDGRANTKISRGNVALGAMSFVVAFLIWRRTKKIYLSAAWLLGCLIVTGLSRMAIVPVALVLAMGSMVWVWIFPRHGLNHLAAAMIAFLILFPAIVLQLDRTGHLDEISSELSYSGQHRIEIYRYTAGLIADRPLSGWGFKAARHIGPSAPDFIPADRDRPLNESQTILPLHPHNMSLQIWLEGGFPGIAFASIFMFLLANKISGLGLAKSHRLLIAGTATFLFVIANISFGIWQFHWLAVIALTACAVLACCTRPGMGFPSPSSR